ncbi:MAG: isoprenyl transferase [Phycisphaeraceae bacterium]|nr:isoprenyl transferase [Phycisphaeraceae bacterium]
MQTEADSHPDMTDTNTGVPKHVAIIMDGNGRWAQQRGLPRSAGHIEGARVVEPVIEEAFNAGVECVTLFSFSSENWSRPKDEIDALMSLCVDYMRKAVTELAERGIRLRVIGRRAELPPSVTEAIEEAEHATHECNRATLCLAINYGSRTEMTDAVRAIASKAASGEIDPDDVTPEMIAQHLYTWDLPDPDLLIRTAGEMRISNYLLWQISYAELVVVPTLWPDFGKQGLADALQEYAGRKRRFGGLDKA